MSISKKRLFNFMILICTAVFLIVIFSVQPTAVYGAESIKVQEAKPGFLQLNRKTRIYDKNGQRLTSYKGKKAILKKDSSIKYDKTVLPLVDPSSKRYAFHSAIWNWYYLPYITIKGKNYFAIKHGGYIKANNVDQIDGCSLYNSEAVLKVAKNHGQGAPVYNINNRATVLTYLKNGQKVVLDRIFDDSNEGEPSKITAFYRIKGTNNFVTLDTSLVKKQLLPYSDKTTVLMINNSYLYTQDGHKFINQSELPKTSGTEKNNADSTTQHIPIISKGTKCTVSKAIALWVPEERRANSFYQLENGKLFSGKDLPLFIKAAYAKYIYGPEIKPVYTIQNFNK